MALTGEYVPGARSASAQQVETYEATGGTKGNTIMGKPVVIVTMLGAKSGKVRKVPVMRVEHDGKYAVVASMGGAPENPEWFHNIVTNPNVELQDGAVPKPYKARLVTGSERDEWWARSVEAFPNYAGYEKRTTREIPVFVLEPR
jgi:deazaflavin-dependent oxidoreductase (nitroreductase family)